MIVPVAGRAKTWLRFEAHVENDAGGATRNDDLHWCADAARPACLR